MAHIWCFTEGGIGYDELADGSGKEKLGQDGGSATRLLMCDWGNRVALAAAFLGSISPYVPAKRHPTYASMKVVDVDIEPYGKTTGGAWVYAKLTISYETVQGEDGEEQEPEEVCNKKVSLSAEVVTESKDAWEFEGEGSGSGDVEQKRVERDVQIIVPHLCYEVHKPNVRNIAAVIAAARAVIGKVGSVEGSPAGSALYLGMDADGRMMSDGTEFWDVTHKFMVSNDDLRKEHNPRTGAKETVKRKGTGETKYLEGDFSSLGLC